MERSSLPPDQARQLFRSGLVTPTAGWSMGFAQANLIAVQAADADDVRLFAERNPAACPVLDVTEPGSYRTRLAAGADLRTDLPGYRVWRDGALVAEPPEVSGWWSEELVCFLIGCSFTFEAGLAAAGIPLRHVAQRINVPMYRTSRQCRPAGRMHGPLVVSMRPVPAALVDRAVAVTAAMPAMHGAPVHIGSPDALGIADLAIPDFGDPVEIRSGEVPVFWACGVTPQAAVIDARLPFAITHEPGHMLITDVPDTAYRTRGHAAARRAQLGDPGATA